VKQKVSILNLPNPMIQCAATSATKIDNEMEDRPDSLTWRLRRRPIPEGGGLGEGWLEESTLSNEQLS
jgi:hypothetical protein